MSYDSFYIAIVLLTWLISSLFSTAGIGSANSLVPIYYSLGVPFAMAAAAGLLLNVFSLSTATVINARNHHVDWKRGIIFLVPAVIMAPLGALIGTESPRRIILILFVIFLSYAIYNLSRSKARVTRSTLTGNRMLMLGVAIGALAGFMGGMLGVGGGIIILPVLTFMEGDYRKVSGTAAFVTLFSSASGFLSYLAILNGVDYALWGVILVGGVLGGLTGSYFTNRAKSRNLRYLLIVLISVVMARLIYSILLG